MGEDGTLTFGRRLFETIDVITGIGSKNAVRRTF